MDRNRNVWLVGAAAGIAIIVGVYFLYVREDAPAAAGPEVPPTAEPALPFAPEEEAAEQLHPVPEGTLAGGSAPPLPPLAESDAPARESLASVLGDPAVQQLLVPEDLIRRTVATIDNLPNRKVAVRLRPLQPTPGTFRTSGSEDAGNVTLDPQNYERYATLVGLVQRADAGQLAALYFHYYPLFQQAYEDLGYPSGYFNDRMVEVIDHVLAAPEVQGPIALVQPNVFYQFADPELEALSAGQKLLIRMGPENAAIIKGKLRELRAAITQQTAQ